MSDVYGVVPTGFNAKTTAAFLSDLETSMVNAFGTGTVQDEQSPLGLINALVADLATFVEQHIEATYQSFDVDQAEGPRLDQAAKYQRLTRLVSEVGNDPAFRVRITNTGKADLKLSSRISELQELDGVTFANIIENKTETTNAFGMPRCSVAYAIQGGDDDEVAAQVYDSAIGGSGLFGNYIVSTTVDGYCQTIAFIRPADVPVRVEVDIRFIPDACNCAPPSVTTLATALVTAFAGSCGYRNGDPVDRRRVTSEAAQLGNLEIVDTRISRVDDSVEEAILPMTIYEKAVIISPYVVFTYVE